MWPTLIVCQLVLILQSQAQNLCLNQPTFRQPDNSDITVVCGTNAMNLQILMCPIYYSGYNESLMALNSQFSKPECRGTADWTVNPPVLKFRFFIIEPFLSICANKFVITQDIGSGLFSDFSSVQSVNISGVVTSQDLFTGTITYRQEMMYIFSCRYPLQYFVNNTEMSVSGVSLAIKDSNGTFISTLHMLLFQDVSYTSRLVIPPSGLALKTRIFAEVRATNLTERFNVLLDRCYASTNPFPINSTIFDYFVGCYQDAQTIIFLNGEQQVARFAFESFRFLEHRNRTVSTYYVHCATRLCEATYCRQIRLNCTSLVRKRRDVQSAQGTALTDVATVSSGPIITKVDSELYQAVSGDHTQNGAVVGVSVAAGIFGALASAMLAVLIYKIHWGKFNMCK